MRLTLTVAVLLALSGCAKSVDPPPDYPVTDETMQMDPDMLGVDLEPRAEEETEPSEPETAEPDDDGDEGGGAGTDAVEPPPP